MRKVIEVCVRNEAVPVGLEQGYELISPGHECTGKPVTAIVAEKALSNTDEMALKVVKGVANHIGAKVRVYDMNTFEGKMRARLKEVGQAPTIVFGKNKIEGIPDEEQLMLLSK
jgi:hypothetical protein